MSVTKIAVLSGGMGVYVADYCPVCEHEVVFESVMDQGHLKHTFKCENCFSQWRRLISIGVTLGDSTDVCIGKHTSDVYPRVIHDREKG